MAGFEVGLPGGASLGVSGIGGGKKSHSKRPYNFARWQMGNQIQYRVKDAKAAGLHPLAALGITPAGSPPHVVGSGGPSLSGSTSFKALSPAEAASVRQSNAQTRLINKQADLVETQIQDSVAARGRQKTMIHQDKPVAEAEHSGYIVPGGGVLKTGRSAGAQDWEDRYWEFGGAIGALMNIGGDAVGLVPDRVWDKWLDKKLEFATMKAKRDERIKRKVYQPGYSFSPYKSQRGNWK